MKALISIPCPSNVKFVWGRANRSPHNVLSRRRRRRRSRQVQVRCARPPIVRRVRVWTCSLMCGQILPAHRSETSIAPRLRETRSRGRMPSTCRGVPSSAGSKRWSERTTTSNSVRRRGTGKIPATALLADLIRTRGRRRNRRQWGTSSSAHTRRRDPIMQGSPGGCRLGRLRTGSMTLLPEPINLAEI
jgi:hypothetical protein